MVVNNNSSVNIKDHDMPLNPTASNAGDSEAVPQILSAGTTQDTQQEQIVTFVDNTPTVMEIFESVGDSTFTSDLIPSSELGNFLERPVLISTLRWTESTPFLDFSVSPWHAFFTHPVIKKKIDNYAFVNCNLHIKVVVNASPFYYGAMLVSYRPLLTYGIDPPSAIAREFPFSQRPHFWIMPQTNLGGDMQLPFFYPNNWLDLTNTTDLTNMGRLDFTEVGILSQANGVSGNGIDMQVYAWASDVVLAGPTYQLQSDYIIQSGKRPVKKAAKSKRRQVSANTTSTSEYEQGPVEKVSSAVANVASKLTDVPVIGEFAKATEYGAKALAGISSLFGWTNVPVISDVEPLKSVPFHALSSSEVGVPADRLTLDPKNELTIDPRTVGLQGCDELAISNLVQREALIDVMTWDQSDASGDLLWTVRVNPLLMGLSSISPEQGIQPLTPMGMVATNFNYWRGDIIFRFRAVATQYHKGRLRITWDPLADITGVSDTTETSFTKIVDLAPDMDVEIRVSYLQGKAYLVVNPGGLAPRYTTVKVGPFPPQRPDNDNGTLTVRVLNDLTGPAANALVNVLVFVRGCDNLSFMDPVPPLSDINQRISYFTVQSDNEVADADPKQDDLLPQIFGGEAIKSMRNVLRRATSTTPIPLRQVSGSMSGSDWLQVYSRNQGNFPDTQGFDPAGFGVANRQTTTGTAPCSYGYFTPFSLIVPAFLGYRGSMIWHFNMHTQNKTPKVHTVQRRSTGRGTVGYGTITGTTSSGGSEMMELIRYGIPEGAGGLSLTNCDTQTGLQVLMPYYKNIRMGNTDPTHWINGHESDKSDFLTYTYSTLACPQEDPEPMKSYVLMRYCGIGPDFNLFFFLNAPVLYVYNTRPATS